MSSRIAALWGTGCIAVFLAFMPSAALARPEYATRMHVSCVSCHFTPWGGGPRTVYGKIFGSRNLGVPSTDQSDVYYVDSRIMGYVPTVQPEQNTNGFVLMEASAAGSVPVLLGEDGSELRAVGEYNFAPTPFGGTREIYVRWRPSDSGLYVTAGRFVAPFGLLTDEHRTYARLQSESTYNTFDTGVALSADPFSNVHVDVALVNDLQGTGDFRDSGIGWAQVANVRWMPESLPLLLGVSQNYQDSTLYPSPYALSLYSTLSLDRLTGGKLTGAILAEVSYAKNWNNSTLNNSIMGLGFFIPAGDSAYQDAVAQSESLAYYIEAKYDLGNRWNLFYKLDYLRLDLDFPADAFWRHGFGFKYFINSNMNVDTRFELATVGRPEIVGSSALAAQNDLISVLQFWF